MIEHWIWFSNAISPFGRFDSAELLRHFGSVEEIYNAKKKDFKCFEGISHRDVEKLSNKRLSKAEDILDICNRSGIDIITMEDEAYPAQLKNVYMPPPVLYCRGKLPDFKTMPSLTIVGTRKSTIYGERAAYEFAAELSSLGFCVVSGMADGVDAKANLGGLYGGTPTVAVLGCGVDVVYPPNNYTLMNDIINQGAVISEFPPKTRPWPHNFPVRNRIMAALGMATLVIEAPEISGALITANKASDLGKDVFVIPGDIYNAKCHGSNGLIKSGCIPVTCVQDIIDYLPVEVKRPCKTEEKPGFSDKVVSPVEKKIAELLIYNREMNIDSIISASGFSERQIISALMLMEINNLVINTGGGNYAINE